MIIRTVRFYIQFLQVARTLHTTVDYSRIVAVDMEHGGIGLWDLCKRKHVISNADYATTHI